MISPLAAAAIAALAAGFSPLEADDPHVREGNARLAAGDPAAALRSYDEAERAVGSRAEIDHDRGNALLAAGRRDEAKDAWRRAAERGAPGLASRALQNLGTALAEEDDREGAVRAFTDALVKDPANEDARFDLEVLLRGGPRPPPASPQDARSSGSAGEPPQERTPPEAGSEGATREDGARAEGSREDEAREGDAQREQDRGASAAPRRDADASAGAPREEAPPGGEPGGAATEGERAGEAGPPAHGPLSRQEAERLLDALRARERNMPFPAGERRRGQRRGDAAKDW